jgi:serine/threonine protein kinase
MDPERWHRVTQLFHDALERPSDARAAYLAEACGSDAALRAEVDALLAGDAAVATRPDPLEPSRPRIAAGDLLGPYRIEKLLGAGGMGEVYKARDTRLDRTVAIKVLPTALEHDSALRQRFDREARAVAALNHPNICVLYDIGRDGSIDFIVMEHLDGETLGRRLDAGAMPIEQVLAVAIQITAALDKAHRAGIVHRDLKPSNVMVTKGGVKVLDFGLVQPQLESEKMISANLSHYRNR